MSRYEQSRILAINSIEAALAAHENDDILLIAGDFDRFDLLIPREQISANSLLFLTLEFWSGWSDSAIHNWHFYEPLTKEDWPRLAKILLSDLRENNEVTNQEIISQFSVFPKTKGKSFLSKIRSAVSGKAV